MPMRQFLGCLAAYLVPLFAMSAVYGLIPGAYVWSRNVARAGCGPINLVAIQIGLPPNDLVPYLAIFGLLWVGVLPTLIWFVGARIPLGWHIALGVGWCLCGFVATLAI
jgi:hypothetical protein